MRRSTVAPCTMQARATPPSNCKSAPTQLCHRQTATRTCSLCTVMAKRSSTSGRCTRRLVRPSLLTNADFRFNAKEVGLATSTGRGTMMVSPEGSSVPPGGQFRLSVGLSSVSSTFTNRGARGSQTSSPGCALRSRRSTSLRSSSRTVKDRIVQKLPLAARIGAFCVLPPAPAGVNRVFPQQHNILGCTKSSHQVFNARWRLDASPLAFARRRRCLTFMYHGSWQRSKGAGKGGGAWGMGGGISACRVHACARVGGPGGVCSEQTAKARSARASFCVLEGYLTAANGTPREFLCVGGLPHCRQRNSFGAAGVHLCVRPAHGKEDERKG